MTPPSFLKVTPQLAPLGTDENTRKRLEGVFLKLRITLNVVRAMPPIIALLAAGTPIKTAPAPARALAALEKVLGSQEQAQLLGIEKLIKLATRNGILSDMQTSSQSCLHFMLGFLCVNAKGELC